VRRYLLVPIDPVNAQHASLFIDLELVALGRVDFFSVKESDNKHDVSSRKGAGFT
jgi:hypothetical protein